MRFPIALVGLSIAVFCTAMASHQSEPLAEQQFKNIVSFKGQKASVVIPAMEFMSSSLKVECTYCHVQDRSSDEKRAKQTAREMIAMEKDINDKNFRGRTVVTCATCHAGHTHPIPVPPITGLDVRPRRSNDVSADAVLAAYAKALSSGPTAAAVKLSGKVTAEGKPTALEATYASGKYCLIRRAEKGDQRQGFNGSLAWFTGPNGVQKVPLEYAIRFVRGAALFVWPGDLPKEESPSGATAQLDGRDMLVLNGALPDGASRASYFFDKQTGLLARATFIYPTILGSIEQITDYSNYKKVGGLEVPMKIVNRTPEGDSTIEFRSAKAQTAVDPAVFEPPQ